jgi:hypothetical protein
MLARIKSWHRRLSWKRGHRHGKADQDYYCPWWALEDIYESAYLQGSGSKSPRRAVRSPPAEVYIRPLEISASTDPSDYELEDSPYWPPPPPPLPAELSPEEKAERDRNSRSVVFLIVLPCWIFHKNDADPWPSKLHGHHNERPLKLDAISGFIYNIKTREHVQTLRQRELVRIQIALMKSKDFGDRARALVGSL